MSTHAEKPQVFTLLWVRFVNIKARQKSVVIQNLRATIEFLLVRVDTAASMQHSLIIFGLSFLKVGGATHVPEEPFPTIVWLMLSNLKLVSEETFFLVLPITFVWDVELKFVVWWPRDVIESQHPRCPSWILSLERKWLSCWKQLWVSYELIFLLGNWCPVLAFFRVGRRLLSHVDIRGSCFIPICLL